MTIQHDSVPEWLMAPLAAGVIDLEEADQMIVRAKQRAEDQTWTPPTEAFRAMCARLSAWFMERDAENKAADAIDKAKSEDHRTSL